MLQNNTVPQSADNSCEIFDSASTAAFDALVDCARSVLHATVCSIPLVDGRNLALKAGDGFDAQGIGSGSAFCRHVMANEGVFAIEDASADDRFCDDAFVTGGPELRFLAGVRLKSAKGRIIGGLLIGDRAPRKASAMQRAVLQDMAVIVAVLLDNDEAAAESLWCADEQRQRVEAQTRDLKLRERQFLQTERIAQVGGWEYDLAVGRAAWSDEVYHIHGYPVGTEMTFDLCMNMYAAAERPRYVALFERQIREGVGYDEEFEIITPWGETRWARMCSEAEIVDGVIRRVFGTTQDITLQRMAERERRQRERQFMRTEQLAKTGGWLIDVATRACHWSDEIHRIHEVPIGTPVSVEFGLSLYAEHERQRLILLVERAARDGIGFDDEFELLLPSGITKWTRTIAETEMVDGVPTRIVGITQDVTQLREAERTLKLRERQFLRTEQLAKVGGWELELATERLLWSDELYRIHGLPIGSRVTKEMIVSMHAEDDRPRLVTLMTQLGTGEIVDLDEEFEMVLPGGERKWTRICAEADRVNGVVKRIFGTTQDITERRAAERELWYEANHDSLTGLANRAQFADRIGALFAQREAGPSSPGDGIGLLMIDVDRLKETNDTLGHAAGDALLQAVAERLSRAVGGAGRVARIGGDEFVVTLEGALASARLAEVAQAIVLSMQPKLQHDGNTLSPQVSIGGALAFDYDTAELLRQKADLALYECKKARRGNYVEFRDDLRSGILHRIGTVRKVDEALTEGRILPYYQPIVELKTGEISSFEALARMRMPDGQIVSAGAFHEALDEHRIAYRLTGQMLAQVSADARSWIDAGLSFSRVGINVTSADFQAGDFRHRLTSAFSRHGIPLNRAAVEVTEMVFMNGNEGAVIRELDRLRGDGVLVALDDFGTGYASLTHLRTLPVDVLKIDKSFVSGLQVDNSSDPIVEALSGLARKLGLQIIAEGIETMAQAERLRTLGCQKGQGFLFARPAPAEMAAEFLRCLGRGAERGADPSSPMRLRA